MAVQLTAHELAYDFARYGQGSRKPNREAAADLIVGRSQMLLELYVVIAMIPLPRVVQTVHLFQLRVIQL